ncbi:hypothetical protein Q0812_02255 [Brevundimonas sp. 2R-24]|uniref:Uncharacterized protein n=1 Tax=Peiella sedimenti TaxID=3061083 RepID=A0ABT8SI61_9CAUL|nr:hypothetical protein [Caulobacteraceae bacterium XZ-24]
MTADLVVITDTHHLRIQPREGGVRFIAMRHDQAGLEAEGDFADVASAKDHAATAYGVAEAAWRPAPFPPFALVRIDETDPETSIRGLSGHVAGLSDPEQVAVFIDQLERVWCVHPDHLIATGGFLPEDQRPGGR